MAPKILISACLLGQPVRYDAKSKPITHAILTKWRQNDWLVPICPEGMGGLATPRDPAEIVGGTAQDVVEGKAQIITDTGKDVTQAFLLGARQTLEIARAHDITVAILKQSSPSCGSLAIYDGTFTRNKVPGMGITAFMLSQAGIKVFDEHQLPQADLYIQADVASA